MKRGFYSALHANVFVGKHTSAYILREAVYKVVTKKHKDDYSAKPLHGHHILEEGGNNSCMAKMQCCVPHSVVLCQDYVSAWLSTTEGTVKRQYSLAENKKAGHKSIFKFVLSNRETLMTAFQWIFIPHEDQYSYFVINQLILNLIYWKVLHKSCFRWLAC